MSVMMTAETAPVDADDAGLAVDVQVLRPAIACPAGPPRCDRRSGRRDRRPVEDLGRSHEAWMHLIVTRDDLGTFAHIHPSRPASPGRSPSRSPSRRPAATRCTPSSGGSGQMADVVAVGHAVVGNPATVPAEPVRESGRVQVLDGVRVELAGEAEAGHRSRLTYRFTDAATGAPITTLRPYLAAAGHIAILREDGTAFAHEHAEVQDADGNPVFALPGQEFGPDLDVHAAFRGPASTGSGASSAPPTAPS